MIADVIVVMSMIGKWLFADASNVGDAKKENTAGIVEKIRGVGLFLNIGIQAYYH